MATSNDLVASVKSRVNIPLSQITFLATDLYRFASEEVSAKLIPLILQTMEEYYVRLADITLVQGKAKYTIPARAIASKLRDVSLVNSDGVSTFPLDRLNASDLASGSGRRAVGKTGFYLEGNQVVLYNVPTSSTQKLRLSYYCRPSDLIDISAGAMINEVNRTNNTITVASIPAGMSATTVVDFIRSNPGFDCPAIDVTPISLAGNVFTFASIPDELTSGDWIAPATKSPVVQIPVELLPLLYQYVVVRILSAQSDSTPLKIAMEELKILEKAVLSLITPRVDGKPKKVVNGRNILRSV